VSAADDGSFAPICHVQRAPRIPAELTAWLPRSRRRARRLMLRSLHSEDQARNAYAEGTVLLGADVDQGCEIARGKGIAKMLVTTDDYVCAPDLVAAAREFIRGEGGCVVSI
jgi:hypothetical protein